MATIELKDITKEYRSDEIITPALKNISLKIGTGEFVAIMGPSGCGKSTLLNILGLLDNPTSGEYYLNGVGVSKYTEAQRTNCVKGLSASYSRVST